VHFQILGVLILLRASLCDIQVFHKKDKGKLILTGLENPLQMETYDGSSDPDDHIENIEAVLNYINV
jgi:hypothetical protein